MIPFLVKLANLLDDRGQHNMAREVDDLIQKLAQVYDPSNSKEMSQLFDELNPNVKGTKPAPRRSPDLIKLIQNAIGVSPATGKWDKATNTAFVNFMNANLPLAMNNGKFVGLVIDDKGTRSGNKLADAWELIKEQTGAGAELAAEEAQKPPAEQTGQASKAPAAKPAPKAPVAAKSKFFQMTPVAQKAVEEIEQHWPGTAQQEINNIDALKAKGREIDQGLFEEILQGRAKPA